MPPEPYKWLVLTPEYNRAQCDMDIRNSYQNSWFPYTSLKRYVTSIRPKKKNVMLPSPDQNLKIGSVGRDFFFFFFLRTVRELSFPIFFFKFLNGENSGGMQSKRIYKSCKCFFKPLNTNFSKFFAQIWHKTKKKKKKPTLFFRILRSVGRGQHNNFFFWALHQFIHIFT